MKKSIVYILVLLVVSTTLLFGCGGEKVTAEKNTTVGFFDWVTYDSPEELTSAADIIIEGVVTNTKTGVLSKKKYDFPETLSKADKDKALTSPESNLVETISEVKVLKVIKGDIKEGSKISINQIGGETETEKIIIDGVKYFNKGESHFFFIKNINGIYSTLNPEQGDILYEGDTILSNPSNPLFREKTTEKIRTEIKSKMKK